jgi:uncharacterized membrane protein YdjX (TVP38/TMEM64 family)
MVQAPSRAQQQQKHSLSRPASPLAAQRISARTVRLAQLVTVLGIAAIIVLAYVLHDGFRAEIARASAVLATGNGDAIGDYLRSFGVWAPVASLGLMLVQAVAAPVPAILVAFANGLAFGIVWGGVLTVAGQTLAAVVCFWIARVLGRAPVEALTSRLGLDAADRWFASRGAPGIFLLRLVPGISFDVVSYAAGLTGIGFGPFVAATALGVTPQAFLYAWLIREAPQSAWALYVVSWVVIGIVLTGAILRARRRGGAAPAASRKRRHATRPIPGMM